MPLRMHQKKSLCLGGAESFQTVCHQNVIVSGILCDIRARYPILGVYVPFPERCHISSSGPCLILICASDNAVIKSLHAGCQAGGRFIWWADFQCWSNIVEFCGSAMFARTFISCERRCWIRSSGKIWRPPQPGHGSMPMRTSDPSLTLQTRLSLMRGREFKRAFQTEDILDFG